MNISRQKVLWILPIVIVVLAVLYWRVDHYARTSDESNIATSTNPTNWRTYGDIAVPSNAQVPVTNQLSKADIKVGNVITVPSKVISDSDPEDIYVNLRITSVRHVTNANPYIDHTVFQACNVDNTFRFISCGIYVLNTKNQLALLHSTYTGVTFNPEEDYSQQLDRLLSDAIKRDTVNNPKDYPQINIKAYPYIYLNIETGDATSWSVDSLEGYDIDHLSTNAPYSTPSEAKTLAAYKYTTTVDLGTDEPASWYMQSLSLYTKDKLAHTITVVVEHATSSQARIEYSSSNTIGSDTVHKKVLAAIDISATQHPAIDISYDLFSLSHAVTLKIDATLYTFNFDTETLTKKN